MECTKAVETCCSGPNITVCHSSTRDTVNNVWWFFSYIVTPCSLTGLLETALWFRTLYGVMAHWIAIIIFNDSLFLNNFIYKFFISIHLLHSSTCFEHYCVHLQEDNCINTASGIVTLFGWLFSTQVTRGRESSRNLCSEESPKESDDTSCCTNTIVLLKMSIIVFEICRGM